MSALGDGGCKIAISTVAEGGGSTADVNVSGQPAGVKHAGGAEAIRRGAFGGVDGDAACGDHHGSGFAVGGVVGLRWVVS